MLYQYAYNEDDKVYGNYYVSNRLWRHSIDVGLQAAGYYKLDGGAFFVPVMRIGFSNIVNNNSPIVTAYSNAAIVEGLQWQVKGSKPTAPDANVEFGIGLHDPKSLNIEVTAGLHTNGYGNYTFAGIKFSRIM